MPTAPRKPLVICGLCSVLLATVTYTIELGRGFRPVAKLQRVSTAENHDPVVRQVTSEYGELAAGSWNSCEFEIANDMASTLSLVPGARTNHIWVGKETVLVEPGGTTAIEVEFRGAEDYRGPTRQSVQFASNDPSYDILELVVTCNVTEPTP